MAESQRRAHLIETALRLFYRNGFHATGIDKVIVNGQVVRDGDAYTNARAGAIV